MVKRMLARICLSCLLVGGIIGVQPKVQAASAAYTVTDVGTLVGTGKGQFDTLVSTNPLAFNEKGEVAGVAMSAAPPIWAVVFTSMDGKIRRIGKESQFSFVFDLNDQGDMVGYVRDKNDAVQTHQTPVVWRDRKQFALPTLGGDNGAAYAFGPDGEIVGVSATEKGDDAPMHATLWRDDKPIDLGTLGGKNSIAFGVNGKGVIVGGCDVTESVRQPCVWRDGKPAQLPLSDGMTTGFISNINNAGEMSGTEFDAANAYYAVRWVDGKAERLPGLFDGAIGGGGDICETGVIVGSTQSAPGSQALIGAMWVDGKLTLLQDLIPSDSGYTIGPAAGINEAGQIVASATTADGTRHGVVISPVDQSAARTSAWMSNLELAADSKLAEDVIRVQRR